MIIIIVLDNVKRKIYEGMAKACEVVSKTFGPNGKNIIIENYDTYISSDGYTVLEAIKLEDELENLGVNLLLNAAKQTKDICGDGTTSTIILSTAFCKEILEFNLSDLYFINKKIDDFYNDTIEKLESQNLFETTKIPDEILENLIFTSSNDEEITEVVLEAIKITDKNGIITYKPTLEKSFSITNKKGFVYDRGIISPYFTKNGIITLENPYIIIINDDIETINEIENIIADIKKVKKDIMLIANKFSKEVVDYLLYLNKSLGYNIAVTLSPDYGSERIEILEDIAIYLNTYVITKKTFYLTLETVGKADFIEITSDYTVIRKNQMKSDKIFKRIEYLKKDEKKNQRRIASLTSGLTTIYIPIIDDYDYELKKEKVYNAVNSALSATKYGICLGRGEAFKECMEQISKINGYDEKSLYAKLNESLGIISSSIAYNINKSFTPYDSLYNLKIQLSNAIKLLKLFISLDGFIKTDKKIAEKEINF